MSFVLISRQLLQRKRDYKSAYRHSLATWIVVAYLAVLSISHSCEGQDLRERFDLYLLNKSALEDGFSVLVEKTKTHESEDGESIRRSIQRYATKDGGKIQRIDAITEDLIGGSVDNNTEHQLVNFNTSTCLYLNIPSTGPNIRKTGVRGGLVTERTLSCRKNPFDIPLSGLATAFSDRHVGSIATANQFKVINESMDELGRKVFLAMPNDQAAWEITYHAQYEECPVEFRVLLRPDKVKEKEGPLQRRIKQWNNTCTIKTEWQQIQGPCYAPSRIEGVTTDIFERVEFRFLNWKTGKSVDEKLFLEEHFTVNDIKASSDVKEVRSSFEKSKIQK